MIGPVRLNKIFSDRECSEIIRIGEQRQSSIAKIVRGDCHPGVRQARTAWLDDDAETGWVFSRIIELVIAENRKNFAFDLVEFAEQLQFSRYAAREGGQFDWHIDIGDGQIAAKRKLTLVIQLSCHDAYRGGDMELNTGSSIVTLPRRRGSGILFPSFVLHRVAPLTQGRRFSLTTWAHGPAFR